MNSDWEHRIEKIEESTDIIKCHVTEIKLALIGSDKIGLKGLAKRVEDAECYIEKDKKLKHKIYGGALVIAFIWGLVKLFWTKIFG